MAEICPVCGLPKDLCVCDQINEDHKQIYINEVRVKGSKFVTRISGIDNKEEIEQLFKRLKKELACGGTIKNNTIELQGRHKKKVIDFLAREGYSRDSLL